MVSYKGKRMLAMFLAFCIIIFSTAPQALADTLQGSAEADTASLPETVSEEEAMRETSDENTQAVESAGEESSDALEEESSSGVTSAEDTSSETAPAAFAADLGTTYALKIGGHDKYMQGDDTGYFRPDDNISRAEVSYVIYSLLQNKPAAPDGGFSDLKPGKYYTDAVNALKSIGIIDGYPNGTFRPNGSITRAEVVKMVALFAEAQVSTATFTDVPENKWYYSYVMTASANGWIRGYTNGTFRPNNNITRAEFVTMMNYVLARHDDGFAADRDNSEMYFPDVKRAWYFLEIIEAAKPKVKAAETQSSMITISSVNFRKGPSTSDSIIALLPINTVMTRLGTSTYGTDNKWYKVSYNGTTGYIHSDYVTAYSGSTSSSGSISAASATLPQYKTLFLQGSTNDGTTAGLTWSSSNADVAYVFTKSGAANKAFVYGKAAGTATISLKNAAGTVLGTCAVTVAAAEPVRFAYTDPNTPAIGESFHFIGVTDTNKTAVKFVVSGGSSYETTTYSEETKSASTVSPGVTSNTVRIFKQSVSFSAAGEYTVQAYAKTGSGSWSSTGKSFQFMVGASSAVTTTTQVRAVSNEMVKIIGAFEGKGKSGEEGEVYIDTLSSGLVPTVGYGYVVYKNDQFYNNLTETEMVAMLSDTINNGSYVKDLNAFRAKYNVKMNQQQFDALVSFGYNLGTGNFVDGNNFTFMIFLNSMASASGSGLSIPGKVNTGPATVYPTMSASGNGLGTLANGAGVTINEIQRVDGNVDNLWYKVTSGNLSGWVRGGYIRFNSVTQTSEKDTEYIDEQLFGSNLLLWSNAGNVFYEGLYFRRMAEARIFCYGDYTNAYRSASGYKTNPGFTGLI